MSVLVVSAAAVLLIDQATKSLVRRCLPEGRTGWRLAFFEIRPVMNPSAIHGSRTTPWRLLGLLGLALFGIALQVRYGPYFHGEVMQIALGAACGGATGNLLDQFRWGAVVDFVRVGWWPVFNVADAGITCGVLTAVWCLS